jgi:hypothetical protein
MILGVIPGRAQAQTIVRNCAPENLEDVECDLRHPILLHDIRIRLVA